MLFMVPDTFYLSEIAAQLKLPFNDIGPFFCAKKDLLLVVVKTEVFLIGFPVVRGQTPMYLHLPWCGFILFFCVLVLFYFFRGVWRGKLTA